MAEPAAGSGQTGSNEAQLTGALAFFARVLGAATLEAAAHGLVAGLQLEFGLDRASLGLHEARRTRLLASTDASAMGAAGELTSRLIGAMDEAIEQACCLAWPADIAPPDAGAPICFEQRCLAQLGHAAVASLPLGVAGELFGAVCLERRAELPFTAAELARLEQLLMLAAPALALLQRAELSWQQRARRAWRARWDELYLPAQRRRRQLLAGGALVLAFLALAPLAHEVGGRARVEGSEQRLLVAPADGFIKLAHVRPGDRVEAGAALVDLLDADLQLEHERWSSQLAQFENSYAAAMAKSDRVAAATGAMRVEEAQAQLALIEAQMARGRIVAPFAGLIVQGDLSQSGGAPVRQGDNLLTLARTDRYRIIIEVDEVDIAAVHPGQQGRLVLSSLPWDEQALVVERITPLARAVEGRNVFEVEARLSGTPAGLRPGLQGRAELVVGRLPLLWAWSGHAMARIRLAYWAWLA